MSLDFLKKCLEGSQLKENTPTVQVQSKIIDGKSYHFDKKYDETLPGKAFEALKGGGSLHAAAVSCGIGISTLYTFRKEFPVFDKACEQGMAESIVYWEKMGEENVRDTRFNHNIWKHLLVSKAPASEGNTIINLQADKDKINSVLGDLIAGKK